MKLLSSMMRRFVKNGELTVIDVEGKPHIFGPGGEPSATIRLTDKALYRTLFLNPELKAGEAYMEGTLICEKGGIRGLLSVFAHNRDGLRGHPLQKALKGSLMIFIAYFWMKICNILVPIGLQKIFLWKRRKD